MYNLECICYIFFVSDPSAESGATRRLPREQRREAILSGATRAFAASGFAATSMADIANASGITQIIVYRHFESKQELYRAVLQRVSDRISTELTSNSDRGGFAAGARAVLEAARRDPEGFTLLWRHSAREPLFSSYASELREQATDAVANSLEERVPRENLRWASHATFGYLVEAVLNWLEYGDPRRDDTFISATNAAMRAGIRAWTRKTSQ